MSNRPSYKKLYLQEKARRKFYERCKPELAELWDREERFLRQAALEMEQAILGRIDADVEKELTRVHGPRKMKGAMAWISKNN